MRLRELLGFNPLHTAVSARSRYGVERVSWGQARELGWWEAGCGTARYHSPSYRAGAVR